ncbi:hypothetical protein X740_21345 [Mesorhizobium sp. LNHC221B00]|nr:hypothetical protein X740_21345 [Mesorhizobium sp. LNHC221B00]
MLFRMQQHARKLHALADPLMAASLLSAVPVLVLFLTAQLKSRLRARASPILASCKCHKNQMETGIRVN